MRLSLAARLALTYVVVVSLALLLLGGDLLWGMGRYLVASRVATARHLAIKTAALASSAGVQINHLSLDDPGMLGAARTPGVFLQVSRADAVIQRSANLKDTTLPLQQPPPVPVRWGRVPLAIVTAPIISTPQGLAVEAIAPVTDHGRYIGQVESAVSLTTALTVIDAVGRGLLEVGLTILLGSSLLSIGLTLRSFRRVRLLTRVIQRINSGQDLEQRVPVAGPSDEVSQLALGFNHMLDRLQESFRRQELIVAQASHQLRTPLSIALGYAAMLNRWGRADPDLVQEGTATIEDQLRRLNRTVDAILTLGSTDTGTNLRFDRVDWGDFVQAWVREQPQPMVVRGGPSVPIWLDRELMREALNVLADNAWRHGAGPQPPEVNWQVMDHGAVLAVTVRDFGPGVSPDLLPVLFQPFAKDHRSEGAGLGLALASTILRRHGGALTVENVHPGAALTLRLPLGVSPDAQSGTSRGL